ncbi:MAG: adenosylhomocysteinase [Rhodospirillales bacterium]|jgi:adenosylhomocysteinase|nr:adenosylhomocysteinase [Rhodospirillales bacterium]
MPTASVYDVKTPELADEGARRVEWAFAEMPVLRQLLTTFAADKPLAGIRLSACLHVTAETANLARVLVAAGAEVVVCASNPLSTQDDVAAAMALRYGIPTFAHRGDNHENYYKRIASALDHRPQITIDDGADLVSQLHTARRDLLDGILGGTEETTTGVIRLRAMAADGELKYPIIAVNDADTKHLFDNRYGTGQSTIDGLLRATNILLAGKVFVVCGYGWCGRGVAARAAGMGAKVIVTEVEPVRALEASMDGYRVMPLVDAVREADIVVTVTGDKHVVDEVHLKAMKDGCILANAGHFDVEINLPALKAMSREIGQPRYNVEEYRLTDGRRLCVVGEGRLVNLAAAEGHPPAVMDMSFADQALSAVHIRQHHNTLERTVYSVPKEIDREVARLKLQSLGVRIDTLSDAQQAYLTSWREGT